ncbi:hypothetical protein BJX63DRAFT_440932 [Aspergillus granulosus]|uniref:NADH:flavin oxidoreductase/NADH oxidase N-terminal domain-containing protein n=1 Tax=Aspergillus granulosus TaxID=176169 RepID=A0ABR4GUB4_9EURO
MFEHLLSPLQVGDLTLKYRVMFASITRNRGIVPQEDIHVPYYRDRAATGLIAVTEAVHTAGGVIFCQLLHPGRIAHPEAYAQRQTGQPVVAPSPIAARGGKFRNVPGGPGYVVPSAIKDPEKILDLFEHAAKRAKEAGFDGLRLHHANGYLPMQFLDKYFPYNRLSIKIAPCGKYNDMGELDESGQPSVEAARATYIPFCEALAKLGLSYVEMARFLAPFDPVIDGRGRGVQWDAISELRGVLKGTPIFGNTAYTPEEAEQCIREGRMDDYVTKLKAGEPERLYQEQHGDEFWW